MNIAYNVPAPTYEIIEHTLTYPEALFYSLCILCVASFIHEFGHYLYLRQYNKDAKIQCFINKGFHLRTGKISCLDKDQLRKMYFAGIMAGFAPILFAYSIHHFYLLLIAPYVVGCMSDIKEIIRLRR